ncbi:MAG TPA: hypothetical protein VGG97_14285 [Bryobacteraceae bacterium]
MPTSDAIAIGAAFVGVGLTILAIVLAVWSFLGYALIRDQAGKLAADVARQEVLKLLDESSPLGVKLRNEIKKRIEAEADRLFADVSLSGAFSGDSAAGAVAEEYPKGDAS